MGNCHIAITLQWNEKEECTSMLDKWLGRKLSEAKTTKGPFGGRCPSDLIGRCDGSKFMVASALLPSPYSAFSSSVHGPSSEEGGPLTQLVHRAPRRQRRCSCENLKDKECVYFCHIGIVWVNTPRWVSSPSVSLLQLKRSALWPLTYLYVLHCEYLWWADMKNHSRPPTPNDGSFSFLFLWRWCASIFLPLKSHNKHGFQSFWLCSYHPHSISERADFRLVPSLVNPLFPELSLHMFFGSLHDGQYSSPWLAKNSS